MSAIYKEIKLVTGEITIVDKKNYEWLNQWKWRSKNGYATRNTTRKGDRKTITKYMHREIMKARNNEVIDHINGDKLFNIEDNLRKCTTKDNVRNSKSQNKTYKYKGLRKNGNLILVKIYENGNNHYIGNFKDEILAANAYNYYAKVFFGEFAWLNDVPFVSKEEWEKHLIPIKPKQKTSKYKGVHWESRRKKWLSTITIDKRKKHLGYFENEEDAHMSYLNAINNKIQ